MIDMTDRANRVAKNILNNIEEVLADMEAEKEAWPALRVRRYTYRVAKELSIFDWFQDELSIAQVKQMRSFVKSAISAGYDGYVCFKVGSIGTSSGMWAYTVPTTTGFSPDGPCLYRSFQSRLNWWDAFDGSGWLTTRTGKTRGEFVRFSDLKKYL